MDPSNSMFLIEFEVEALKSHVDCRTFYIKGHFADVFKLNFRDTNVKKQKGSKKKLKRKKIRSSRSPVEIKLQMGQSLLFESNINALISSMEQYPIELSLWSQANPDYMLGSTVIHWSSVYIDYLHKLLHNEASPPAVTTEEHFVFDEYTSRRMACITFNIKLTHITTPSIPLNRTLETANKQCQQKGIVETGIIKTTYSGGKHNINKSKRDEHAKSKNFIKFVNTELTIKKGISQLDNDKIKALDNIKKIGNINNSIACLVRSNTDIDSNKQLDLLRTKSYTNIKATRHLDILNYIFGDPLAQVRNQVYCVGYFSVENNFDKDPVDKPSPTPKSSTTVSKSRDSRSPTPGLTTPTIDSEKSSAPTPKYSFKLCDKECLNKAPCSECSIDLPKSKTELITIKKCKIVECESRKHREPPPEKDDAIYFDLTNMKDECCKRIEKVEEVKGTVKTQITFSADPCYCSCECEFQAVKKTTYCTVCGGYEVVGEELPAPKAGQPPFPCPIFHKLDTKKTTANVEGKKSGKGKSGRAGASDRKSEEGKEEDGTGKKKKDDRFKFNYGYQGIPPHIGHSQCAFPCSGTLNPVPKHMGWLWTADNIPGLKFRPFWKPGAVNKHVGRMYKLLMHPDDLLAKRRRREEAKKKKPAARPLIVVHKKDGEYTVTMERIKNFSRPRALNQQPFEEKSPLTYTVGRTEKENRLRKRRKELIEESLELEKREYIQSAFQDMCEEICLKTYQQALGILPDTEDPDCTCYPALPDPNRVNLDRSCSCMLQSEYSDTDTDDDEWVVEFTPPLYRFDPKSKPKKLIKADNTTQYTYLDYRVNLLDRFGNPVPRYFIGPDGKRECSDLGGFWSSDRKWLDINVDGIVGQDGRWQPMNFLGPNGEFVESEQGKFQAVNETWLIAGTDGYVDNNGKWRFYRMVKPKPPVKKASKKSGDKDKKDAHAKGQTTKQGQTHSEAAWSCFGEATPKLLSEMGIVGHGQDRKLLIATLEKMMKQGQQVKVPNPQNVPRTKRGKKLQDAYNSLTYFAERVKCNHNVPSDKGILAVDDRGHKTYFRLRDPENRRPKDRMATLDDKGISLSSFHVPCFSSFINSEVMKQQQLEHILHHNAKVPDGWKPGCISKRLLRKLNQAKMRTTEVQKLKPLKKSKKRVEDKPTLIVAKRNGEYHIEMQVKSENTDGIIDHSKPLIYKIASANNEEKIKNRERKERRLIDETAKKIFSDAYHPDICEKSCLKAYKQAIGVLPDDPNNPECICSDVEDNVEELEAMMCCSCLDEELSSDSSLDLDWEIHFSPPIAYH